MDLEDDVGAAGNHPADALRGEPGRHPGGPTAESRVRKLEADLADPSHEAGPGIGLVATPRVAGRVQMDAAVVHDATVAGPELEARDGHVVIQGERQGETPVDILSIGREVERLGHRQDEVGLTESPTIGEPRRARQIGRIALDAAGLGPTREDLLLQDGEPGGVEENASARMSLPRGHLAGRGHLPDEVGPLGRIPVSQQGERTHLTGAVALGTVLPEDRRDVFVESDFLIPAHRSTEAEARGVP